MRLWLLLAWLLPCAVAQSTYFKWTEDSMRYHSYKDPRERIRSLDLEEPPSGQPAELSIIKPSGRPLRNGEFVTVRWKAPPARPYYSDVIALYCGESKKQLSWRAVRDYIPVVETGGFAGGAGELTLPTWSVRERCRLRYLAVQYTSLYVAATSDWMEWDMEEPIHGRLALTARSSEMRISWTVGKPALESTVRYGTSRRTMPMLVTAGQPVTLTRADYCGTPANNSGWNPPGWQYSAVMSSLLAGQRYYYQFGSPGRWSQVHSFIAPPAPYTRETVPFGIVGDQGVAPWSPRGDDIAEKLAAEAKLGMQLLLHVGDLAYSMGRQFAWEQYMFNMQPALTAAPMMVTVGNHDFVSKGVGYHPEWGNYKSDSGGECGKGLQLRFHAPPGGNSLWWYSYNWAAVHVISISTEHSLEAGSPQRQWIERDLSSVRRAQTPWVVLVAHRPVYASTRSGSGQERTTLKLRQFMDDLLEGHVVHLVLAGHKHSYERSCPVRRGQCVPSGGVVHVVVGGGGARASSVRKVEPWQRRRSGRHGYMRAHVNRTDLHLEYVEMATGKLLDSFTLRQRERPAPREARSVGLFSHRWSLRAAAGDDAEEAEPPADDALLLGDDEVNAYQQAMMRQADSARQRDSQATWSSLRDEVTRVDSRDDALPSHQQQDEVLHIDGQSGRRVPSFALVALAAVTVTFAAAVRCRLHRPLVRRMRRRESPPPVLEAV